MPIPIKDEREMIQRRLSIMRERRCSPLGGMELKRETILALERLSPREKDVFQLLALGLTYNQMSLILGPTCNTLRQISKSIRAKISFGLSSEEITLIAFFSGLVTQEDFELNKCSPLFLG